MSTSSSMSNEKTTKKSPAESTATASEPKIQIAPDSRRDEDREPRATLPDFDPKTAKFEEDGYAHDTIPAPPLEPEDDDELDTQQS